MPRARLTALCRACGTGSALALLAACAVPSGMSAPPLLDTREIAVLAEISGQDGRAPGRGRDTSPRGAGQYAVPHEASTEARASALRARAAVLRGAEPAEAAPRADLRRRAEALRAAEREDDELADERDEQ